MEMEQKRLVEPESFQQLELDHQEFKRFAYQTHPKAYLEAGLKDLPLSDWLKTATATASAPRDLLNPSGIKQIVSTGTGVLKELVADGIEGIRGLDKLPPIEPGQFDFTA